MTRRGGAGEGSDSKGCIGAEHGKAWSKERGDVALRAALESAVQLRRGDEGNRQAEMANPTKCRESLQHPSVLATRRPCLPAGVRAPLINRMTTLMHAHRRKDQENP
jgi:hypothetical protein